MQSQSPDMQRSRCYYMHPLDRLDVNMNFFESNKHILLFPSSLMPLMMTFASF